MSPTEIARLLPRDLPLCPAPTALEGLSVYLSLLHKWNRALNLTGVGDPGRMLTELVCDSFHLAWFLGRLFPQGLPPTAPILDLGAGSGLPGLPLRLVWTEGDYIMIEAREKRAIFLSNALSGIPLARARVFRGRAENYFAMRSEKAHCIVSRAFMPWQKLLGFCAPQLQCGASVVIMSSEPPPATLETYVVTGRYSYSVNKNDRWLWAARFYG